MFSTRLAYAEKTAGLSLPEGGAVVFGATGSALDVLPDVDNLVCVQPDRSLSDQIERRGVEVVPDAEFLEGAFAMAMVLLPRARVRARLWIAQAVSCLDAEGTLIVDGDKTDGIDSLYKACRKKLKQTESITKAHGRLFWASPNDPFADWMPSWREFMLDDRFLTGPGVFSADHVDPGSKALVDVLPDDLSGSVADLGAGWGFLSAHILERDQVSSLDVVESDHVALKAARVNLSDPRVRFHWADATCWSPETQLDAVVMNPPFHIGRTGSPALGQAFIQAAAAGLKQKGQLWLVANRHLPYEETLNRLFRDSGEVGGTSAFKILRAARPRS